jgi:hypothetical protein
MFDGVRNCHAPGVDSIVLLREENPKRVVRIFVAHHDRHSLDQILTPRGHYTIGVHNHRYDLTVTPILGAVWNYEVTLSPNGQMGALWEYGFSSALLNGAFGLTRPRKRYVQSVNMRDLKPRDSHHMRADELHTVVIPKFTPWPFSVWMVEEGPDVMEPLIYSPRKDLTLSSEGLYEPMTPDEIDQVLSEVEYHSGWRWSNELVGSTKG